MRPPKFNFVPERHLAETYKPIDPFFTCSIYTNGQMVLNSDYVSVYELDKKFVRLYLDKEKRTIGWKIIEGDTNIEELSDARQITVVKGMVKISITPILHLLGWEKGASFKQLPIKEYKTLENKIDYIEVPNILNN